MSLFIFLPIILPIITSFIVYAFKDKRVLKNIVLTICLILTFAATILNCFIDSLSINLIIITNVLSVSFNVDKLSMFFSIAISFIWLIVTIFNFEYIKHEQNENRFYTFSLLTLSMLISLTYSANLVTMYLSFEFITLLSMPLVLHSMSKESINGAKKYLFYSIGGAFIALFGLLLMVISTSNASFVYNGVEFFKNLTNNKTLYQIATLTMIIGFATKCGMFPMHGWLPTAHPVAISTASALLSGVITKAGVICIIRVVYYFVGIEFIANSFVQYVWLILAMFTVFLGSLMAFLEKTFKKRLAYSTVSQVSYILCGLALLNETAFKGALLHVVSHMLIKVCLFLYAGVVIYKYNYHKVDELKGIGKKLPISTFAYTIASLGLIGIPFTSGFISKWYLAEGALNSTLKVLGIIVCVVLLISAIFTAGYLLPISVDGFIVGSKEIKKDKESKLMVIPLLILSMLVLLIGIYYQPLLDLLSNIIGK